MMKALTKLISISRCKSKYTEKYVMFSATSMVKSDMVATDRGS